MSRQTRRALAVLGSLVAVAGLALAATAAAQANGGDNGHGNGGDNGAAHDKVTLCHWVPAHGGSFVVITVDVRGANGNPNLQGHAGHAKDIIPMPAGGCPAAVAPTSTSPAATNTPATTTTPEATETPAGTATTAPVSSATPTGTATGAAVASTNTPTSTNTPAGGAAAVATNTSSAGVAGAQVTPAGAVQGASALPSTGSGGGSNGHTRAYLLLGLALLASGTAIAGSAFLRRTRG